MWFRPRMVCCVTDETTKQTCADGLGFGLRLRRLGARTRLTRGAGCPDGAIRFASERGDERRELVRALAPALVEAHCLVRFAIGRRPVPDARGVARLAALILEGQDHGH